jgi:hypothetical protein
MSGHTGWARLLGADPVPGLLAAGEPTGRWVTRTAVLGQPADHPEVAADHAAVRADPATAALLDRLPDWTAAGRAVDVSALASSKGTAAGAARGEPQVIAGRPAMKPAPPLAWSHRHAGGFSPRGGVWRRQLRVVASE